MTEATNENVNLLLTKLMTDHFCKAQASDLDACVANFVPQKVDGSFVDQTLQRRGLQKCEPYKEAASKCMQDEAHQQAILKRAQRAPTCKSEREMVARCHRANPGNTAACERYVLDLMMCGLVYLVQKKGGHE